MLELKAHAPELLEGLDGCDLVCIDDIHAIAGMREWEQRLVGLYDRLRLEGKALFVAAPGPPDQIGPVLPDLSSRFAWGGVHRLATLDDGGKQEALMRRAAARGLTLPEEVAAYLLTRASRDLHALMRLLDTLDRASLAAQRRLSLPLVKSILAADRAAG
jgi:DnaA family protein